MDSAAAEGWIRAHVEPVGAIETAHERPWATVLRVPLADSSIAWFKACAPVQAFEPRLTAGLFARWPDRVAEVLGHDEERAWLLLADAGTPIGVFGNPPEAWLVALPLYAELQRGEAAHTHDALFGSKDELIGAYLERRHEARRRRFEQAFARCGTPRERLVAVFDDLLSLPDGRGCAFINAGAESPIGSATEQATQKYRAWLVELFTDQAQAAGAADPEALAAQLMLLYDGAAVGTRMDGPAAARPAARQAAELLVEAATKRPRRARAD